MKFDKTDGCGEKRRVRRVKRVERGRGDEQRERWWRKESEKCLYIIQFTILYTKLETKLLGSCCLSGMHTILENDIPMNMV